MFIEFLLVSFLSIIICLVLKKNILNIKNIKIRGTWYFIAAALIQIAAVLIFKGYKGTKLYEITLNVHDLIICITYQFLLIGIIYDLKKDYMKIFFIGTLLNFIVILVNDCKMPVLIVNDMVNSSINIEYLELGNDLIHTILDNNTKLRFLSDIIILNKPYPFVKTISIGDIFLMLGTFGFWQEESSVKIKAKNI